LFSVTNDCLHIRIVIPNTYFCSHQLRRWSYIHIQLTEL